MKNTLFSLLASCILAIAATSCDSLTNSLTGPKMNTPEATQKVIESLTKNVDPAKWKIYNLYWMEGEKLENNLQTLVVGMINTDNSCFTQTFQVEGPAKGTAGSLSDDIRVQRSNSTFDGVKGITIDMINVEAIQSQYDAAIKMIPAEYDFKSIGSYTISEEMPSGNSILDKNKNIGSHETTFSVLVTERGKEVVENAGKKSIQYYELNFEVLPDGTIQMKQ